jgi:RimJ/RimL family protein N-acetyltransferase
VIETPRLTIRKWDLARDLDDAVAIYGDPEVMRYIPCGALDKAQTERLVQRMIEKDKEQGCGIWPVVHKAEGRVIGECGVTQIPGHEPDIEIAWIFNKDYHGQGYASEAGRAVMEFAFTELHIARLYALIDRFNPRSIAVANRLGMRYDRIIRAYKRDLMRYEAVHTGVAS